MSGDERDRDDVVRFWRRLGLPGIIDVHTHFMPERVLDKVWAYFDSAGPLTGLEWPITYRRDEDERLALLRSFGVLRFTSMLYPHKAGMAAWLNGWAADFAARVPDCLHTATFFPEEDAGTYVRKAVEAGARVFKAHIQVGAYDPNDPLLDPVWGLLAEAGIPVVTHCGSGPATRCVHGSGADRPGAVPPSPAEAGGGAHGDAGVRGVPRAGGGASRGAARHDRGVHRLRREFHAVPGRMSAGVSPIWGTGSCSARTSRTSRIRTPTSCTPSNSWGSVTRGCVRSATTTRAGFFG